MKPPIKFLYLGESPKEVSSIKETLQNKGVACEGLWEGERDRHLSMLKEGGIELVFIDITSQAWNWLSAIETVRRKDPNLPIIILASALEEEQAINALMKGATDYVLKEHDSRLVPAVHRAIEDKAIRLERQSLEKQLIEAQKMEVIGHLAGGIAHDFNNILSVIMGYSELLAIRLGSDHPLQEFTKELCHAAKRAAGLTRQLLIFSRRQTVQMDVIDLNQVLKEMNSMLQRLIGENINLVIESTKQPACFKADAGHIAQVLMNLVINARDAMPVGGTLTITASHVTLREDELQMPQNLQGGDYVVLSVQDTGTGMTDEVKSHLFEPFFTTKPIDKGTGLGLATCRTIVEQSGGYIQVHSEVGHGTTFKVYYPRVDQSFYKKAPPEIADVFPRGSETLLVVEDDPAVRHLAAGVLEAQGYTVLRASNGQEGMRKVREHRDSPIRLVVTDVIMPEMGGKMMTKWLQTMDPELKVLFTSGYADDVIANHGVLQSEVAFLPKPYTPAALGRKVRSILDGEAESITPEKDENSRQTRQVLRNTMKMIRVFSWPFVVDFGSRRNCCLACARMKQLGCRAVFSKSSGYRKIAWA